MVMLCHLRLPQDALAGLAPYGALGVDLFFAISGFLITLRLIEEHRLKGAISLQAFYIRRFFRIIPPAVAYLGLVAVLGLILNLIPMNGGQIAASALFFRNYYPMAVGQSWYTGHFWSLSAEEHFYLLWPGLLVLCGLEKGRLLAPATACAVAIWRALDIHYGWIGSLAPALKDSVARTDYRLDGLLWGCALAFVWKSPAGREWLEKLCNIRTLVLFAAGIGLLASTRPPGHAAALAILFPLCLCCTVAHSQSWLSRLLEAAPVAWLGRISYSLYLWQQLFLPTRGVPQSLGIVQAFPWNLALTVAAASASYYAVEQPLIAWGRSIVSRRAAVGEAQHQYAAMTQS